MKMKKFMNVLRELKRAIEINAAIMYGYKG